MVKLRPHQQSTISSQHMSYSKLAKRLYGPFQILDQIGSATYKLQLPKGAHIHPVFHCSMLKPFHHSSSDNNVPPLPLPATSIDNQPIITPLAILSTRRNSNFFYSKLKVLVQWEGLSPDDTSWEDWDQLRSSYHLEDKVILEGKGDDNKQEQPVIRPKIKSNAPTYLKYFI